MHRDCPARSVTDRMHERWRRIFSSKLNKHFVLILLLPISVFINWIATRNHTKRERLFAQGSRFVLKSRGNLCIQRAKLFIWFIFRDGRESEGDFSWCLIELRLRNVGGWTGGGVEIVRVESFDSILEEVQLECGWIRLRGNLNWGSESDARGNFQPQLSQKIVRLKSHF